MERRLLTTSSARSNASGSLAGQFAAAVQALSTRYEQQLVAYQHQMQQIERQQELLRQRQDYATAAATQNVQPNISTAQTAPHAALVERKMTPLDDNVRCCVCKGDLQKGQWVTRLPCGHFHHTRLPDCGTEASLIALPQTCPICSGPVMPRHHFPMDNHKTYRPPTTIQSAPGTPPSHGHRQHRQSAAAVHAALSLTRHIGPPLRTVAGAVVDAAAGTASAVIRHISPQRSSSTTPTRTPSPGATPRQLMASPERIPYSHVASMSRS